jgi:hypothetical protein
MTRVLLAKAEVWQVGLALLLGHCCVHSLAELPSPPLWVSVLIAAMALAVAARSTLVITLAMSFIAGLA